MKICILTPRLPFLEDGRDILRINNLARSLKRQGHFLVLVTYCTPEDIKNRNNPPTELYDTIYRVSRSVFVSLGMALWAFIFGKPILMGFHFSLTYLAEFKKAIKKETPDLYVAPLLWMTPYLNICRLQDKSVVELAAMSLSPPEGVSTESWLYRMEKKRISMYERKMASVYKKCVQVLQADDDCFSGNKP